MNQGTQLTFSAGVAKCFSRGPDLIMCRCSQADRYDILQVSVVQALGIQFEAESSFFTVRGRIIALQRFSCVPFATVFVRYTVRGRIIPLQRFSCLLNRSDDHYPVCWLDIRQDS